MVEELEYPGGPFRTEVVREGDYVVLRLFRGDERLVEIALTPAGAVGLSQRLWNAS